MLKSCLVIQNNHKNRAQATKFPVWVIIIPVRIIKKTVRVIQNPVQSIIIPVQGIKTLVQPMRILVWVWSNCHPRDRKLHVTPATMRPEAQGLLLYEKCVASSRGRLDQTLQPLWYLKAVRFKLTFLPKEQAATIPECER